MAIPVVPGTWRGVLNRFNDVPEEIQAYFHPTSELIKNYDWEVSLAFMFSKVEQAHNYLLYAGAVKIHKANSTVARRFVDQHHITRKDFKRLFKNVIGIPMPHETAKILHEAEKVRDKIIHGKHASEVDKRKAIVFLIEYAKRINRLLYLHDNVGIKPFVYERRGFAGRRQPLEKSTSMWLMKGLGFGTTIKR